MRKNQNFLKKIFDLSSNSIFLLKWMFLTLKHPIGFPPDAPIAQKIADQRWLIADSAK